jgi:hypothetical protein
MSSLGQNALYLASLHRHIVAAAAGALDGTLSVTEAARALTAIGHELRLSYEQPFLLFVGIASETDEFPLGEVRDRWNPAKLVELDAERSVYENRVRPRVVAACEELLRKYAATV